MTVIELVRSRRPLVICLGLSALDHIWHVEHLPAGSRTKVRATAFASKGGGMAATAAVTIARLGGNARFWGRAGDDPEGRLMRESLAGEGVDVSHFRLFPGARSSISGVIVEQSGERHIANFRGEGLPETADWLPLELIRSAGAVLADPRWVQGAVAAFEAARRHGAATVLDADVAEKEVFEALLPLTDHAIFSAPALTAFAGENNAAALERVSSFGCAVAAVTRGAEGVLWRTTGAIEERPAFPVPVVDTNGAGDVFHGAYALAIAAGAGIGEAMVFASAAAALKCTRPGGRDGIPTLDEILQFQRTDG